MKKAKKLLISFLMTVVWLCTFVILLGATTDKGRLSILLSGILLNSVLAIFYSLLDQWPSSLREWFTLR